MPLYPTQLNFPDRCFPHQVRLRKQDPTRKDVMGGVVAADDATAGGVWPALVLRTKTPVYGPTMNDRPTATLFYDVHLRADPGLVQEDYVDWLVDLSNPALDLHLMVIEPADDATGDNQIFMLQCQRVT